MKACSWCKTVRPLEQFWSDPRKPDGREHVCCVCRSLRRAQRLGRMTPHKDSPWRRELLPLLAQRLCAQLHGEDAPPCEVELISVDAWHRAMRLICGGARPRVALRQASINEGVLRAYSRYEPRLAAWLARAKQVSKRRGWPSMLDMGSVLGELVRNPGLSARSACRQHDVSYTGFLARTQTPDFEPRYLRAKSLQRDRSFGAMSAELEALGDGVTRATRRSMAQRVHELKRLEPRRGWSPRQLNPVEEARQRVAAARRKRRTR
jgi:hypothetical protein